VTAALTPARRWAVTLSVMLVTTMQILDTSVINVALPHMRGSLSAGADEITWALTLYLAANAVAIPATGWLTALWGRRRLFLVVTTVFTFASLLSGLAPTLDALVWARVLQGLGAGPIIPLSQAVLWEVFPFRQRGLATAVWGIGVMVGPIVGPTLGGWIADEWSWRWIFLINLPIGMVAFALGALVLFDPPYLARPARVDWLGLAAMTVGFGALQLVLDRGEREDWFASAFILALALTAAAALALFLVRQLTTAAPILDLRVFADRNFAVGTVLMAGVGVGLNSSMLLVALYAQQVLRYDAWTAGSVLAPAGIGNLVALVLAGRLAVRRDQRLLVAVGWTCTAVAGFAMSTVTSSADYWTLVGPRFVQGFGTGFLFVPLATMALATVPREKLANATACFNVVRNFGGSAGIALVTTLLGRRAQYHQSVLVAHVSPLDLETQHRLTEATAHFAARGADPWTAAQQATAWLYERTVEQARVLAFADCFWLLAVVAVAMLPALPLMRRIRAESVRVEVPAAESAP
jgi:DHA2 family multidrug resistance protein